MSTKKIERINFGKIEEVIKPPNLIEIQVDSYREFLQIKNQEGEDIDPRKRRRIGLQAVFEEIFPVKSYDEKCELDFLFYEIGKPKVSWLECLHEGLTFGASLHVTFRLKDEQGGKEEKVFMGEIPLMTPQGTFIVNGAERVIVSQLHRSPGLAFETTQHPNGKMLHSFRIIPDRGSWYEAQFDTNDMLWVYLDRKKRRRKFLATTFFRALGCSSNAEILKRFYKVEELPIKKLAKLNDEEIQNRVPAEDVTDLDNGGKIAHAFEPLSKEKVKKIADLGVGKIQVVNISFDGGIIIKCLKKDPTKNLEEALKDIYRRLRPGDPPTITNAKTMIQRLFFDPKRYDLGGVGRYKINQKIGAKHWSQEGVEELDLSDSITECLKKENVETVGDLVLRQVGDLKLKLPHWSEKNEETPGISAFVEDFLKERKKVKTVEASARMLKEDLLELSKDWCLYVELKIQDYLKEAKIKTVRDLVEKTQKQLQDYPGYTEELFKEIEERLENYGKKQGVNLRIGMPSLVQRKKALDAKVDKMGLSARIQECLEGAKIRTVRELVEKKPADLVEQDTPKQTKRKPTIKDLYDLFGLDEKATAEQLQKSYRKEMNKFHPDQYQGLASKELRGRAEEWTKRIGEAKKVLEDYQKAGDKSGLDKEDLDYWNAGKYWGESDEQINRTVDAEDVEGIEKKLEEFGRKKGVDLRLGMSFSELERLERELDEQGQVLDRLERALKKKIDEIFLIRESGKWKKALDAKVDKMGLSARIQECLEGAKIRTVRELVEKKPADLVEQDTPKQTKRKPTIKDLYDLFGLDEKATAEQLQKSYRKEMNKFHPDQYQGLASKELRGRAEEWTKRIGEAKKVLEDYQKAGDKSGLDKEDLDYWNAGKYWGESDEQTNRTVDAEDVEGIEKKLEEFGRKKGVDLRLGMSRDEFLTGESVKKVDEAALRKSGEGMVKEIEAALRKSGEGMVKEIEAALREFGEKRSSRFYTGFFVDLRLGMEEDEVTDRVLEANDLVEATKYLLRLKTGKEGSVDDIDHLGSRRVRTVGELLANQCRVGLARTERLVKERMTLFDQGLDTISPQRLINPKALSSVVRDFFGRSQLSQFMDQINPLAELTHKRRLSALGPGGLSRERAGFEVRDVHPSHYGRICPIETPEGPNIGLIASLAAFARVNDFGFIETPYRKVNKGRVPRLTQTHRLELKIQDYLKEAKIKTVRDLVEKTQKQLRDYPGYTEELFKEIEERLENYGKKQGVNLRIGMPSLVQRKKALDAKVDKMGLSARIQECLEGAKIRTVRELVEKKPADLVEQDTPKQTKRKPTIKDLYDLFGLDEKATAEQLQKSYRKEMNKFHPDQYQGLASKELRGRAEEWTKRIGEAKKVLEDYQKAGDKSGLDKEDLDYWNAGKYWGESDEQINRTVDAEDVEGIEKKLEEFGRKKGVDLRLGMSFSELERLERELDEQGQVLDRLERALKKKIDEIFLLKYLTADEEEKFVVAQANTSVKENGELERAMCRKKGDFIDIDPQEGFKDSVHYMDVSPKQLVSVAAGLIPFLEHDDANRALMGSNMQRQAVPLLATEAPFVGTGLEKLAAQDSRSVVVANDLKDGVEYKVASINFRLPSRKRREKEDNSRYIVITKDGKIPERRKLKHDPKNGIYLYQLRKFMRSNAATCINQRSLVAKGQVIKKGDVIADGPCTDNGELALGRNVLCAFMPWNGYNFEDAVLISRRIVKDDVFTSIHIDEFEVNARDTKLGPEEITRDIPNLGEEALKDLGADGIIREGAEVKPGDILVGKVTPKSETELAPEEKLLRAIFGEKAADVKDSSLRVPSGTYGIVMEVRDVKKENERSSRSEMSESKRQAKQVREDYERKRKELLNQLTDKLSGILLGEKIPLEVCNSETAEIIIPANKKITKTSLKKLANNYDHLLMPSSPIREKIFEIIEPFKPKFEDLKNKRDEALDREESGVEEEEAGVVKSVKVFIASKRKLSVGDKMAGRHGNKGVVAQIVPEEDMPFLANGTPVDIVLNPLGVPSRMNVGQVLETHLGWASKILGVSFATPIFDGIKEKGEEKKNEEGETLHNLLKKWKDESLSVASSEREKEKLREKLREYGVRDYLKAADDLVKETDGVAWDFGMASSSSNGSADGERKEKGISLVKEDGKAVLYDGRTGEPFNQEVVVGYIYMLKLGHLVADKIHARAVGPYSLVTQQPLGGKAQYGGQRFGEMEVWAMEAYGAAHALQELITVKSDDVQGRTDIYASVVNGVNSLNAGVPESFNVLVKEIQSLGMDVQVGYVRGRESPSLPSLVDASPTLNSEPEEPHRV